MANVKKIMSAVSQNFGISVTKNGLISYGVCGNYSTLVFFKQNEGLNVVMFGRPKDGMADGNLAAAALNSISKVKVSASDYSVNAVVPISGGNNKISEKVIQVITALRYFFEKSGYVPCDACGADGNGLLYEVSGRMVFLVETSYNKVSQELSGREIQYRVVKENVVTGTIGAVGGAIAGGLVILLIARLGYISWAAGVVMGFAIVFGYKKLGGKFTKKAAVISSLISVAATYLAFRMTAAIDLYNAFNEAGYDITFGNFFKNAAEYYELLDCYGDYIHNLVLMMICGVLGTIIFVGSELSSTKEQFKIKRIV